MVGGLWGSPVPFLFRHSLAFLFAEPLMRPPSEKQQVVGQIGKQYGRGQADRPLGPPARFFWFSDRKQTGILCSLQGPGQGQPGVIEENTGVGAGAPSPAAAWP